jgi:predicted glycosyltransferase
VEQKLEGNLRVLADGQRCYEDLLRSVDVVVTKPGYGIVADVISHQLPILYTDRGEFPESARLVQALEELATAEYVPQNALLAGDLRTYLEKILAKPRHWPAVPLHGAAAAADQILALLQD